MRLERLEEVESKLVKANALLKTQDNDLKQAKEDLAEASETQKLLKAASQKETTEFERAKKEAKEERKRLVKELIEEREEKDRLNNELKKIKDLEN